jgi:hypothetical protein
MKPQDAQMNHEKYAAPNTVLLVGSIVPHILRLQTLMSVDEHFGQTPVFFTETSVRRDPS